MPLRVVGETLSGCSGCEISILNTGETLLDLLPRLEFVHFPLLMDHKVHGQRGEREVLDIPEADLGLLSGCLRTVEELRMAEQMRRKCRVLVALGTCATHGGIPSLGNQFSNEELLGANAPQEGSAGFLDRVYALDEKIKVDVHLPGCPPHPDHIAAMLCAVLDGEPYEPPGKSVCDSCPVLREGKGSVQRVERSLRNGQFQADRPLREMQCFLEQGLLCLGPVTRGGCGGGRDGVPRCMVARVPCRGCYGPARREGNQLLDMLNVLASNGIDVRAIPDRASILRFSGAHGLLIRPRRKAGK